jgi:hypothetical protein
MVCELDHRQFLLVPDVPLPPPPTQPRDEDGWLDHLWNFAKLLLINTVMWIIVGLLFSDHLPTGIVGNVHVGEFLLGMSGGFFAFFVLQRAGS